MQGGRQACTEGGRHGGREAGRQAGRDGGRHAGVEGGVGLASHNIAGVESTLLCTCT